MKERSSTYKTKQRDMILEELKIAEEEAEKNESEVDVGG